ncbi:MAG TPA: RluA family pseudouridine synthase [Bacteroidales bacterium]|nr:RluA family pseudouridine synthase [Bacteroidales bacterium]
MKSSTTAIDQRILYEDNHLLIVNKMPSEIVQGDKTGDVPLVEVLKNYIGKKYEKPGNVFLGVVHRIDRPTSGLVIFARTSKALTRLNKMLKDRELKKKYWAVVKEELPESEGELEHFLLKNEKQNKSYVVNEGIMGSKKAVLHYKTLLKSDHYSLVEVELITGRHHQIRAQFAAMGCPIKGDLKYGFDRSNADGSIHLHARQVEFPHPVKGNPVAVSAPVPDETLWHYFESTLHV